MPPTIQNLSIFLDKILSPPPNFANLTYHDRLKNFIAQIKAGKNIGKNLIAMLPLSLMVTFSWIIWPLAAVLKKTGFRFVDIDLSQIGSIIYLDVLLKEDALTLKTPKWKILVLASYYTDGNSYLVNLYRRHVILIRNPFLKFALSPFFVSDVFGDNSFKYDSVYHTENKTHEIWRRYRKEIGDFLIEFPIEDLRKARNILEEFLPAKKMFVVIHARDMGFYKISSQVNRNGNILDYEKAIKYLIEKGYAVIRIGDNSAKDIQEMIGRCGPMLFDYAHSKIKSEMMDSFLLSNCNFFIGLASGPASIPPVFGIRSCNVNWFNAATAPWFMEGDLVTIKKFRYTENGELVPFDLLFSPPFSINPSLDYMKKNGVFLEENSEEEIFDTVREFLEMPREAVSDKQKRAKSFLVEDNYSYGAAGNFSETILKKYSIN